MGWNGSGTFTRSNGTHSGSSTWADDAAAGELITTDRHDTHDEDLATGINACLAKNGENSMSGSVVMDELADHSASVVAGKAQLWTKSDIPNSLYFTNDAAADINISAPPPGIINGLTTSNGTDTDHDIDIAVGACADSGNTYLINLTSGITKRIDADWAEGTTNGGLASGARAVADTPNASTTYHFFLIAKTDGTVDGGWDTSLTAANLLTDAAAYTYYRRIASHLIDASNNITAYRQDRDIFTLDAGSLDVDATNIGSTEVDVAMGGIPAGVEVLGFFNVQLDEGSAGAGQVIARAVWQTDNAASNDNATCRVNASSQFDSAQVQIVTDTSRQITYRGNSNAELKILTTGWRDLGL